MLVLIIPFISVPHVLLTNIFLVQLDIFVRIRDTNNNVFAQMSFKNSLIQDLIASGLLQSVHVVLSYVLKQSFT